VLIVTSDKAYENQESCRAYRETDALGGHDPYSASKACAEIAAVAMRRSFFGSGGHPARIATARAGNVIGGGDWSADRLVPDIVRGCLGADGVVRLRNPAAIRPWQHVLEPLTAYLLLAERLCTAAAGMAQAWNFGPEAAENRSVSEVANALVAALGRGRIEVVAEANAPHEAHLLTLDCAKAYSRLGWRSRLDFAEAVSMTAIWYAAWARGDNMTTVTRRQIAAFTAAAP
jgi:CDP-glucose 4,6-dehydratase